MLVEEIKKYHQALHDAIDSPHETARVQIELAGQAGYISNKLKTLRNKKPEFFIAKKREKDPVTGKLYSNEMIQMFWEKETAGEENSLKNDLEILDRFLSASKGMMVALSVESKVSE